MKYLITLVILITLMLVFSFVAFPLFARAQNGATPTVAPLQYSTSLPTPKSLTSDFSYPQTIQAAAVNNGEPLINRAAIEWLVILGLGLGAAVLFGVRRYRQRRKLKS